MCSGIIRLCLQRILEDFPLEVLGVALKLPDLIRIRTITFLALFLLIFHLIHRFDVAHELLGAGIILRAAGSVLLNLMLRLRSLSG